MSRRHQPMALNNLALMELPDPKRLDEAISFAQKAVQNGPNVGQFLDTLGWAYHVKRQNQDAVLTLKKGVVLAPDEPEIHYHLGVVYEETGLRTEALREIDKSLSIGKDFPDTGDAHKRQETLSGHSQH